MTRSDASTQAAPPTIGAPAAVDLRNVSLADELGDGGEGTVFDLGSADRGGPALVLKRYQRPITGERRRHLEHLVALRQHLSLGMGSFAWPQVLVTDGRDLVGVLMPRAPAAFWATVQLRSGRMEQRLRESQYLLFPSDKLHRLGIPFASLAQRLEIFGGLVAAISRLHGLNLVYGDVSARNILYSGHGHVGVFLLDCDGIVEVGTGYVIDSPDWNDPHARAVAGMEGDVYKLGLFAARMLAVNPTTRAVPSRGGTPRGLVAVLDASLDPDPRARPSIAEIASALAGCSPGPPAAGTGALPDWGLRPGSGDLVRRPAPDPPATQARSGRRRRGGG